MGTSVFGDDIAPSVIYQWNAQKPLKPMNILISLLERVPCPLLGLAMADGTDLSKIVYMMV